MKRQAGGVSYTLLQKPVKNINLHVKRDGTVWVSAPPRVPLREIDAFVQKKALWIERARQRITQREQNMVTERSDAECLALFEPIVDRIYPVFAPVPVPKAETICKDAEKLLGRLPLQKRIYYTQSRACVQACCGSRVCDSA